MKTPINTNIDKVKSITALALLILLMLIGVSFTSAILATSITSATFAGMVTACFISSGMTVLVLVCVSMLISIGKKVSSEDE